VSLNRKDLRSAWWTIAVLVMWTLVLLVLMSVPVAENRMPQTGVFRYWDKIAHVFLFGVTGFVNVYGARFFRRFGSRLAFGLIFSLFLAFGTESAQAFISYRTADVYDLMADLLGIFMGLFVYLTAYLHEGLRRHLRL
jgi:VanZ family protein